MNNKLQTASEASYREASNLPQKLQKHQAFEAELTANEGQLEAVIRQGNKLLNSTRGSSEVIETRVNDLQDIWTLLSEMSANKGQRLQEAIQKQTFERNVGDLETWISEVENMLASKDYGKDLKSATNLLKRHQLLEGNITSHEDRVTDILQQADAFVEAEHFMKDEIAERAATVFERFEVF